MNVRLRMYKYCYSNLGAIYAKVSMIKCKSSYKVQTNSAEGVQSNLTTMTKIASFKSKPF